MLAASNLRFHKTASNAQEVMEAFPSDDYVNGVDVTGTEDRIQD